MKTKLLALLALSLSVPLASIATERSYIGAAYAESVTGKSLFSVERRWKVGKDQKTLVESFNDGAGNTAATLETNYRSGQMTSVRFSQKQTDEVAVAEFRDGRVFYATTVKGKTKESDEAVSGAWVAFNAVPEHIVKNWSTLVAGSVVKFRMPVPIMRDSFGFSLSRTRTWVESGRSRSEFKLESSSALIRMLADPMFYVLDDGDKVLLEYRGRIIAKVDSGGKLKDLDATVKYQVQDR